MNYTTETIRVRRREIVRLRARKIESTQLITKAERDCLRYAVEGALAAPPTRTFSDVPYALELALGRHDEDGGID